MPDPWNKAIEVTTSARPRELRARLRRRIEALEEDLDAANGSLRRALDQLAQAEARERQALLRHKAQKALVERVVRAIQGVGSPGASVLGAVYRAIDDALGDAIALASESTRSRRSWEREAQLLASSRTWILGVMGPADHLTSPTATPSPTTAPLYVEPQPELVGYAYRLELPDGGEAWGVGVFREHAPEGYSHAEHFGGLTGGPVTWWWGPGFYWIPEEAEAEPSEERFVEAVVDVWRGQLELAMHWGREACRNPEAAQTIRAALAHFDAARGHRAVKLLQAWLKRQESSDAE